MQESTCVMCAQAFVKARTDQRFCSKLCGKRYGRDSRTKVCEVEGCERPLRARGLCSGHYSKDFKARHPDWRERWPQNPERRRSDLRMRTSRRRALLRDPAAENIDRDVVAERDGWRCHLCGKKVTRSLMWPHPQSASLDHLVPLSRGGTHTMTNVRLAHLFCNMSKGNRSTGDQLLLFG